MFQPALEGAALKHGGERPSPGLGLAPARATANAASPGAPRSQDGDAPAYALQRVGKACMLYTHPEQEGGMHSVTVWADQPGATISRHVYGHFSEHLGRCIYGGYWVGDSGQVPNTRGIRNDVVAALRHIRVPNLRWPGGCFADTYHWKDGIGPRHRRPSIVNTHWGGVTENNHFGTHEFMDLCEQLGCDAYICGNVGSGSVREMQEWVEYLTFDGESPMADLRRQNGRDKPWHVPFWGVGNENWGCGGSMRPEYYADLYRRFATYVRDYGENRVFKIACGANSYDYRWTDVLMRDAARWMHGLSLHYYTNPPKDGSRSATEFGEYEWFSVLHGALAMDELVRRHAAIMDVHDPQKRIALVVDEWGTWYEVEPGTNPGFLYQQNTMRDALVAALTLNVFHAHADRVRIANLAQTVNVLQAPILTDGSQMVRTPTYHVFDLYAPHQDAVALPVSVSGSAYEFGGRALPKVHATASRVEASGVTCSFCNLDYSHEAEVTCEVRGTVVHEVDGRILAAPSPAAHNTAEAKETVSPQALSRIRVDGHTIRLTMPPASVATVGISAS